MKEKKEHTYAAIDLKSFYASVECVERGLDPLTTNLVVADESRTEKTICLAVSPSLKTYGISGRARLFEVIEKIREVNRKRKAVLPNQEFTGESCSSLELERDKSLAVTYIIASPRMAYYMEYSTRVYDIYLEYIAPEDMHVYSVDEVFMDITSYHSLYQLTPRQLIEKLLHHVLKETGITATAGIGTNLYLCKIAMDIVAKHADEDENGVRIAELDEISYRRLLWNHTPLTDFWRVGAGYAKKLKEVGLNTMGDIARCSLGNPPDFYTEDLLYSLFGINAELLIDHAWGWEPTTIKEIQAYQPENNSISSGQVLQSPYDAGRARLIVKEMTDLLVLDLVDKQLVTDQMVLTIGYDTESLTDPAICKKYHGDVTTDHYGRRVPKHAHGTGNLSGKTSSMQLIMETVLELYDRIINPNLLVRRITLVANHVEKEETSEYAEAYEQMDLFTDYEAEDQAKKQEQERLQKEKQIQQAVLDIKKRYGKNAVLKGMNFEEGATARERNSQIGGHKA